MSRINRLDIVPFAYKKGKEEWVWEEQRDIESIVLVAGESWKGNPEAIKVYYWWKTWPEERWEIAGIQGTGALGWAKTDDWFNGEYRLAATKAKKEKREIIIGFCPLTEEFPAMKEYPVRFRRTMKLKIDIPEGLCPEPDLSEKSAIVYTTSSCKKANLLVEWKGRPNLDFIRTYNCQLEEKVRITGEQISSSPEIRQFNLKDINIVKLKLNIMAPSSPFSGDRPLVTLYMGKDGFTFNPLEAIENPVYLPNPGVLIKNISNQESYEEVVYKFRKKKTVYQMVEEHREQSLKNALRNMPAPDLTYYFVGCRHSRQKFQIFPDGSILIRENERLISVPGRDTPGIKRDGNWCLTFNPGNFKLQRRFIENDELPILHTVFKKDTVLITQTVFATPLLQSILSDNLPPDAPVIAMVRFIFKNTGKKTKKIRLKIFATAKTRYTNTKVMEGALEELINLQGMVYTYYKNENTLRFAIEEGEPGKISVSGKGLLYEIRIPAKESRRLILKIPFTALKTPQELSSLAEKKFEKEFFEAKEFWYKAVHQGCRIMTPEPILNRFHTTHLAHIFINDEAMPDDNNLVNTCVGTVSYGNFSNEACMIINDLDQRGLHREAERRLEVFFKYQGTVPQPGNFTDFHGMFFGAGGYECGAYNQHHGWVLWCMGEHFRLSGDRAWLLSHAEKLIEGCEWVIRQRQLTKKEIDGERVWEYGFLPAGSLEDVTEFYYWLSTNVITWWGLNSCAQALLEAGHPEGKRLVKEAEEYAGDLKAGFERARLNSPVVRLRDGTYIPHYPSRLYLRGRDYGWIREVLEGAIYLITTHFLEPTSQEATWILQDYEDNRYIDRNFGYGFKNFKKEWFNLGGFSMQPNLLPGPVPYIERDQIKHFLRAFFNGFASAFRPDLNLLVEHPLPALGKTGGAHFKTSDEANVSRWLKFMFVYTMGDYLYIGRGIPRQWFAKKEKFWLKNCATRFGIVSIEFCPLEKNKITCILELELRRNPGAIFLRVRHPRQAQIKRVLVNNSEQREFDPEKEWVILENPGRKTIAEFYY